MKKLISLLIAMMIIVTGLSFGSVSADEGGSVIGNGIACEAQFNRFKGTSNHLEHAFAGKITWAKLFKLLSKQGDQYIKHCFTTP